MALSASQQSNPMQSLSADTGPTQHLAAQTDKRTICCNSSKKARWLEIPLQACPIILPCPVFQDPEHFFGIHIKMYFFANQLNEKVSQDGIRISIFQVRVTENVPPLMFIPLHCLK